MFVRKKKRRRNQDGSVVTYLQLVENKRVEGKTRQRVLCTLGRADGPKLRADLGRLVSTARRYAEEEALVVDESTRVETKTRGPHLVWGRLWEETLGRCFGKPCSRTGVVQKRGTSEECDAKGRGFRGLRGAHNPNMRSNTLWDMISVFSHPKMSMKA